MLRFENAQALDPLDDPNDVGVKGKILFSVC